MAEAGVSSVGVAVRNRAHTHTLMATILPIGKAHVQYNAEVKKKGLRRKKKNMNANMKMRASTLHRIGPV